jgi:Recombinase
MLGGGELRLAVGRGAEPEPARRHRRTPAEMLLGGGAVAPADVAHVDQTLGGEIHGALAQRPRRSVVDQRVRVKEEADRLGLRTKCSTTANGTERNGKPFSRGHLYGLLANPIYTGRIAHKGRLYPGQHPALIDDETWTAVQDQLAVHARDHRRRAIAAEPSLLAGLLVDAQGERLTPSHAVQKGRRYRYYVSAALITAGAKDDTPSWRLAAQGAPAYRCGSALKRDPASD